MISFISLMLLVYSWITLLPLILMVFRELSVMTKKHTRNCSNCTILDSWVFDYFILANELFPNVLQRIKTFELVNNDNLCGRLLSSLESLITFDERFNVTSVPVSFPDFDLLSCELDNFTFKMLHWVNLYWYHVKKNKSTVL